MASKKGNKLIQNLTAQGFDKYGNVLDPEGDRQRKIGDEMGILEMSLFASERLEQELGGNNIQSPEHIELYKQTLGKKMLSEKYGKDSKFAKFLEEYSGSHKNRFSDPEKFEASRDSLRSRIDSLSK